MSSLGYRRGCDKTAARPAELASRTVALSIAPAAPHPAKKLTLPGVSVLKGFIPLVFYFAMFTTAPLLYQYVEYDYTSDAARIGVPLFAGAYALAILLANDCTVWFNMVLGAHIGLEIRVLDLLMKIGQNSSTSDGDMVIVWTAFAIVGVHLLPFLLVDHIMLLGLLAFAGVVVNAIVLVYIDSSLLLLVGLSSVMLMGTTLCIGGVCEVQTSLLSALRKAMLCGEWITFSSYSM